LFAYLVVVAFLEKPGMQDIPVSVREPGHYLVDDLNVLALLHQLFEAQLIISDIRFRGFQRVMLVAEIKTPALGKDVPAHRVHVGTKPPGVIDGPCLDRYPDPAEGFLTYVFNGMRVDPTGAKRDLQAFAEVRDKVVFSRGIMSPKATEIFFIERIEVHWSTIRPVYFTLRLPLIFPDSFFVTGTKQNRRPAPPFSSTARLC
jgi:hypothetical protein